MGRCRLLSVAALAALLLVACAAAPSHAGPVRDPAPSSSAPPPDEASSDRPSSSAEPGPGPTPEQAGAPAGGKGADPLGRLAWGPAQAPADDVVPRETGSAMPSLLLALLGVLLALLLAAVPAVAYRHHEATDPPGDDGRWRRDWEPLPGGGSQ